ncbi:DUF480 domain-containing protein [Cupriavidus basilensis]
MSLNALTSGCNQKTARSPVMNATEAEILTAIDGLKRLSLVMEGSSSRVPRFEQNMKARAGRAEPVGRAALQTLLPRGPQTVAELRRGLARLHAFADISSVEVFLEELASAEPPFVVKLPRALGGRGNRLDPPAVRRSQPGGYVRPRHRRRVGAALGVRGTEGRTEGTGRKGGAAPGAG